MARTGMTVLERVKRSQQVGSEATTPTVNQLGDAFSVQPGTSAIAAPPLATPDQVKMMGTPAQKAARVSAPTGETALEQATKLRAPKEASAEDEAKKRQAAALAGALGPMGDKVNQLVSTALTNITAQKVEATDSGLQLKVNSAAEVVKKYAPAEQEAIANLVAQIGATVDPGQKAELVRQLNEKLGRTAESALTVEEVPAFMAAAPEVVKGAAATAVTRAVGDKVTLEDLGQLGTTQEELATLLGVSAADIPNLTISDLQSRLATRQQEMFAETQATQAGLSSALLSSTERAALRDVLATMEETGVAGAEFQVGQIGKDIADGRQVTIGNQTYTVEELLSAPAMTDIVKQVLDDPEGKTAFVKSLKETNPDLFSWVISSKDGLEQLVKGTATAAGAFRDVQQANLKLLAPLDKFKDYFAKAGINIGALRTVNLTEEVTLPDGTKGQRWQLAEKDGGLPTLAKAILTTPPEKQGAVMSNLSQLPAEQTKTLTTDQIAALGLDSPGGLWSKWAQSNQQRNTISAIPDNQPDRIIETIYPGQTLEQLNQTMAEAILNQGMGGPIHPVMELDVDKNGRIDAADMPALKQRITSGSMPSLADVASSGQVPGVALPKAGAALDRGPGEAGLLRTDISNYLSDGSISPEEQTALADSAISADTMQAMLDRGVSGFPGAGDIRPALEIAIQRKVNKNIENSMGLSLRDLDSIINLDWSPLAFGDLQKNLKSVTDTLNQAKKVMESNPGNATKKVLQTYIARLEKSKSNMETNASSNLYYSMLV